MKKLFGSLALIIVLVALASTAHAVSGRVCGAAVTDGYFIETNSSFCPLCTETQSGRSGHWVYGCRVIGNKLTKCGCTFYALPMRPIDSY